MGDLYICLNVYMEAALLPECLASVKQFIPNARLVAVDGPYAAFVQQSKLLAAQAYSEGHVTRGDALAAFTTPVSNDGTLDILHQAGAMVITNGSPWEDEYTKRSRYFVGKPGDTYFVLDADERLSGPLPTVDFGRSKDWCVNLLRDDMKNTYPVLRYHAHDDGMRYRGAHHALWRGENLVKRDDVSPEFTIPDIHLIHRWCYRAERDPSRHSVKGAYYRDLSRTEAVFRQQNGI